MEERVPSAKVEGKHHNHFPPHSPQPPPPPPPASSPPPHSPRRPPSFDESETYIVQVPRDLVYRVPPPENAKIVESYRNPSHSKNHQCGGKSRLRIFLSLAILALIAAIAVAFIHMFLSPKTPEFSITKLHVKSPPTSHHRKKTYPSYVISLKAVNPNPRMGVSYEDGGDISLSYKKKKIAQGKYPTLSLDSKDSTTVRVTLHGSKAALPSEVQKSMDGRKSKRHVSLSLSINAPVKLKGLIGVSKDMKATCDFKVSTLASGTRLLSQDCDTKF